MILKELFVLIAIHLAVVLCENAVESNLLKTKENDDNEEKLNTAASEGIYNIAGYGIGKYPYTNGHYNGGYGSNNYGYASPYDNYNGYNTLGSYSKGYGSSNTHYYPSVGTGYSNYPSNGYGGYAGYGGNGGLLSYSGYQQPGYYNNGLGYDNKLPGNLGYGYYQQRNSYPSYEYNSYNRYPYSSYGGSRGGYASPGYVSGYRGYSR